MKTLAILFAMLLSVGLVHGCKDDTSPSGPTSPPEPSGTVRAICRSVGLGVEAGTLVGGDECNEALNFNDDESCEFSSVSQSFSGGCQGIEPDCGADFSTDASGSVDFFPEFDSSTGGLTAVRVSGSVSASFQGSMGGACGQIGNSVKSLATVSIEVEVIDDPVTAQLSGTLNFGSTGATKPGFLLTASSGFEIRFPDEGRAVSETFELQPGTYEFTLLLRANPNFNAGASAGDFNLSLRFE